MTAHAEFLDRIRKQVERAVPLFSASTSSRLAGAAQRAEVLRRELRERWRAALERFQLEFERVGGTFHRIARVDELPALVGRLARERQARSLVTWDPAALGFDPLPGLASEGLEASASPRTAGETERERVRSIAARADLGLTGAELAVGETGSLVVLSGEGRPRSTSLLPPCHVAVFDRNALVESLEQVGVFLEAWHGDGPLSWRGGVINIITGPSRTADIELTLTRGVHGPKEVHAVFVESDIRG